MSTYRIDNQGRLVLPASWREKHGVKPGTELVVLDTKDGRLSVQTVMQAVREAQEIIRRTTRPGQGSAVDELLRERRREVELEQREQKPTRRRSA